MLLLDRMTIHRHRLLSSKWQQVILNSSSKTILVKSGFALCFDAPQGIETRLRCVFYALRPDSYGAATQNGAVHPRGKA